MTETEFEQDRKSKNLEQAVESGIKEIKESKVKNALKGAGKIAMVTAALPVIAVGYVGWQIASSIAGLAGCLTYLTLYPVKFVFDKIESRRISHSPIKDKPEEEYLCPKCNAHMEWDSIGASAGDAGSAGYWCKECEESIELYIQ